MQGHSHHQTDRQTDKKYNTKKDYSTLGTGGTNSNFLPETMQADDGMKSLASVDRQGEKVV